MRNVKRRHAVMSVKRKRKSVDDEASSGWGLFDPSMWNRGTAAAKAVCCGSAIRQRELDLTVDVVYVNRALCESDTARYDCKRAC